ncbi:hypothetical protein IMZ48_46175 [Candidatus Bathyarchaeota archaeon]|nr:hypothetical protein [Candidatus Bathyarchaeota archaeon]
MEARLVRKNMFLGVGSFDLSVYKQLRSLPLAPAANGEYALLRKSGTSLDFFINMENAAYFYVDLKANSRAIIIEETKIDNGLKPLRPLPPSNTSMIYGL